MDAPESPPAGSPSSPAGVAIYEDSPVFDFINSLSPIATPTPLDSVQNAQLFKSSDLAPVSSIFTSPQANPQKESKLRFRDGYIQVSQGLSPKHQRSQIGASSCIVLSASATVTSESFSPWGATIFPNKWPQSTPLGGETSEDVKIEDTDGKTDHTADVEQVKLASTCSDLNDLEQMELSTSGRNSQEDELAGRNAQEQMDLSISGRNYQLAACNLNQLITHCGTGSSLMSQSDLSSEVQPMELKLRSDGVTSSKSLMPMDQESLEDSQRKMFDGSSGSDATHGYCAGGAEGVATKYDPEILPGAMQSQLVSKHYLFDTLEVPNEETPLDDALSQHQCGMHRRSLFSEKVGASSMRVQNSSVLDLHQASMCGDTYLKTVGSPAFGLPGIGLHLNAVASISSDNMPFTINPPLLPEHNSPMTIVSGSEMVQRCSEVHAHIQTDHYSQKTMPSTDESGQESHKIKRRKLQNGDGDSCRRCSCKKSKCLKLYCACFAAKEYCSKSCSCQGCLNNDSHEETVLCIRKRTESRNPLAFAPTVTHSGSNPDFGDNSNKTPASARHKRGCNCRKSSCLKKYCECFQSGVGCSISCRCESCKNSFGRREGVLLLPSEKMEKRGKEKSSNAKEEKLSIDKQGADQSGDLSFAEDLLTTPSIEPCRSSVLLPSACSKLPLSTAGCSSLLGSSESPLEICAAEMILGNDSSDIQEGISSCTTKVKVVSPNKKRISPMRIGPGLSPIGRAGRKLVLKSIPSFPSLTGDVDSVSPTKRSASAFGT